MTSFSLAISRRFTATKASVSSFSVKKLIICEQRIIT
jgi:hypothetical protein